jgi:hypothetical protein
MSQNPDQIGASNPVVAPNPLEQAMSDVETASYRSELRQVSGANLARLALSESLRDDQITSLVNATNNKRNELTAPSEATIPTEIPGIDTWSPSDVLKGLNPHRDLDYRERQVTKGDR